MMSRNLMRCMYSTPVQLWVMKHGKIYYRYSELWKTLAVCAVDVQEMGYFSQVRASAFKSKYTALFAITYYIQLFGKIGCVLSTFCVLVFLSFTYQCSVAFLLMQNPRAL